MGIRRFWNLAACVTLLAAAPVTRAQLTVDEKDALSEALYIANISEKELEFERKNFKDSYRAKLITDALDRPIQTADEVMGMHMTAKKSMSDMIRVARNQILVTRQAETIPVNMKQFPALPEAIREPVGTLVSAIQTAEQDIKLALSALTAEEQRLLLESLPVIAVEEPKVKFDFLKNRVLTRDQVVELIRRIDLDKVLSAGLSLNVAVEKAMNQLRGVQADVLQPVRLVINDVSILVYGRGSDKIDGKGQNLILDLGGNDSYSGRVGGGVLSASVAVDLGGDDTFDLSDVSGGAGLLGAGVLRVVGGNDVFRTKNIALGSGILGVGGFAKEGGEDYYSSETLSQGFGIFGIGVMIDTAGTDTYRGQLYVQGAARTQGVGWIVDRMGDDLYSAGGLSWNRPLFPDVHYSNAQGYASGFREDTGGLSGGIGMLTDLTGDDTYSGETYCQAASYWYSLGSLFDGSGHDTYTAYHYAQCSAMHATAAYLFDLRGDDGYITKFGASHSIGHDYGVSFLLDREGNDIYTARDSNPATGNANGVAIFLDSAGDDRYQGPAGRGNAARGTGSVGLFVDMAGQDKYFAGLNDGEANQTPTWGIALDREDSYTVKPPEPEVIQTAQPGSLARPSNAELEKIYAKATQWAVGTAQAEAQENIAKLILIGTPAVEWMLDTKLKGSTHLSNRTFWQVINGIGPDAKETLARKLLLSNDLNELRNGLSIATDGRIREVSPTLSKMIRTLPLQRIAVRAAGELQAVEAIPDLLPLCANSDRNIAAAAMIALSQIGSDQGYSTAEAVITQPNLLMRKAAQTLIAKFPERALVTAKRLLEAPDEHMARAGLEILGLIGTPEALTEAGGHLFDPVAGIRIQAMQVLAGRCPAEFRQSFATLKNDPIPSVRAAARRLSP